MDYLGQFGILQYILLWFVVFLCFWFFFYTKKRRYNLPPGPRGLPILGILPILGKNPHLDFSELGKKYGGIFSVYLGRTYVVVVTDVALAKQLLNKSSTADRPPGFFGLMPDGVGFAENSGSEWIEQRRYCIMQMKNIGFGRSDWEQHVKMEVSELVEILEQSQGEPMEIEHSLSASVSNNVLSLLTNHRLPMGHPRRDIINNGVESFQRLYNQSTSVVHFPKLFKFLVDLGLLKAAKNLKDMMNMNKCIRQEIEELKKDADGHSFIHKYLEEVEKNKQLNLRNTFNERSLIGNAQALVIAGSDTTYISILWLLLAMASFPEVQQKVHEELDDVLGKDETVDWIDRLKLPYCLATIMEGQRWRTIAPLNLLHRTNEDININGYDIPKGANLMTVIWAYHNDSKYWKDPDTFQPERFLSDDSKIKEQEAYMPFSYGKRICVGMTVANIELFQYFVSIMQKFNVLPESEASKPDLEGFPGLTLQPKRQPLRFVQR